jgi:hypothetical protein
MRRFQLTGPAVVLLATSLFASPVSSQESPVRIALTEPDEYVLRSITVVAAGKGSEEITLNPLSIAFDPDKASFVFAKPGGGQVQVAASALKSLVCRRSVRKQNPAAQEASWSIETETRPETIVDLSPKQLAIDSNQLVVSDPRVTAAAKGWRVELNKLEYRRDRKTFRLTLQPVKYTKKFQGGTSDPSGSRKGL